jgi:hypothetical protein
MLATFVAYLTTDPRAGLIGALLVVAAIGALKFAATGAF